MPTRGAAAREAAFLESAMKETKPLNPTSITKPKPGQVQKATRSIKSTKTKSKGSKVTTHHKRKPESAGEGDVTSEVDDIDMGQLETDEDVASTPANISKKRKAAPSSQKKKSITALEPVKGGWNKLPHNMGEVGTENAEINDQDQDAHNDPDTRPKKRARKSAAIKTETVMKDEDATSDAAVKVEEIESQKPPKKISSRGKAKKSLPAKPDSSKGVDPVTKELKEESKEEFQQDLGSTISGLDGKAEPKDAKRKKIRASRAKKLDMSSDVQQKVNELLEATDTPSKKVKKGKTNPYGLTPGITPFPDFAMPTVEACKLVEDALSEVHGKVEAPKEIPAPSLEVTGCGEVPSVLDALIRTRLSASTTSQNAKYAFIGLVDRYGIRKEGVGAGSVDWNKVRESDVLDIEKAIKKGGLAKTKSVSIKKILEMVHDQNIARRDAFIKEKQGGDVLHIVGADRMTQGQKDMEIDVADKRVLSLDYMHGLTADEAMTEFVKYPGIGVKTASCVILFCLQRPSFAVDTHVWRFCKWLKWVPEGATRDLTFSHCEVRIPNDMKYSLHQLFIRHGKTCGRCRAITGESSEVWESTVCPIEHLVERTGKKKGGPLVKKSTTPKKTGKGKKGKKSDIWVDGDMSDLADLEEPELDDNDDEDTFEEQISSAEEK